jgi:GNAT superfamily N-acetyltransferase
MLPSDGRALGLLADAADRGTIDDHGETEDEHVEELTATLGGRYGRLLVPATHVVTHANGTLVAAALFTRRDELPFLAFCLTHPHSQGRGLATGLIARGAKELAAEGDREIHLAVSEGNRAVTLYQRLGFPRSAGTAILIRYVGIIHLSRRRLSRRCRPEPSTAESRLGNRGTRATAIGVGIAQLPAIRRRRRDLLAPTAARLADVRRAQPVAGRRARRSSRTVRGWSPACSHPCGSGRLRGGVRDARSGRAGSVRTGAGITPASGFEAGARPPRGARCPNRLSPTAGSAG